MWTQEPKTTHKIVLSALCLLVAMFIAGFLYVYFADQTVTAPNLNKTTQRYMPLAPPPKPGANAQESISVESLDTPVAQGSNTSLIINTNAGSICTIVVTYNGVVSTDSGLSPKHADSYGNVTWSWTVPVTTPVGNWPIKVTCLYRGRAAVDVSELQVSVS